VRSYHETELRQRAKRLGAVWRSAPKVWELTWADARRLGIADRVVSGWPRCLDLHLASCRHIARSAR